MPRNLNLPLGISRHAVAAATLATLAFSVAAHAETGDLPCANTDVADVWTAAIAPDANAEIRVDTVAANTAFDPALDIVPAEGPQWVVQTSKYLGGGDDEFPCAFAPANDFACPFASGTNGAWTGAIAFMVFNVGGCTGATVGEYVVTLTVNGSPQALTLAADDEPIAFIDDGDPPTPEPGPGAEPSPTPSPSTPQPSPEPADEPDAGPSPDPGPASEPGEGPNVNACACAALPASSSSLAGLFVAGLLGMVCGGRRRGRLETAARRKHEDPV